MRKFFYRLGCVRNCFDNHTRKILKSFYLNQEYERLYDYCMKVPLRDNITQEQHDEYCKQKNTDHCSDSVNGEFKKLYNENERQTQVSLEKLKNQGFLEVTNNAAWLVNDLRVKAKLFPLPLLLQIVLLLVTIVGLPFVWPYLVKIAKFIKI